MYMIMFVLDNNDRLDTVLKAWAGEGVTGATFFETSGLNRQRRKHIPMPYTYGGMDMDEEGNTTLFAIVKDEAMAKACLKSAEAVVGDLDEPKTGVFSAWPLAFTKGILDCDTK